MPKHIPYPCPFCGSTVTVEAVLEGLLFTCQNIRRCGAAIKFDFNPRSPHGERQYVRIAGDVPIGFQPTLPARGATTSSCV